MWVGRYSKLIANNKQTTISTDLETMIDATMCLDKYIGDGYILLHDHDPHVCQEGETFTFTDGTLQKLEVYCDDTFDLQKRR